MEIEKVLKNQNRNNYKNRNKKIFAFASPAYKLLNRSIILSSKVKTSKVKTSIPVISVSVKQQPNRDRRVSTSQRGECWFLIGCSSPVLVGLPLGGRWVDKYKRSVICIVNNQNLRLWVKLHLVDKLTRLIQIFKNDKKFLI